MESTILLIEDNDDNAAIYTAILEHFGHRVVRAADGAEGVRLATELRPALIVLDISLPVLSGWDVAASLRARRGTERIPILVCTAHDSTEDQARAREIGCAGFLIKPCAPGTLLSEVDRVLRSELRPVTAWAEADRVPQPPLRPLSSAPEPRRGLPAPTAVKAALVVALIAAAASVGARAGNRNRGWSARLRALPRRVSNG